MKKGRYAVVYTAADFGYEDDAMLVEPNNGVMASAAVWASEVGDWDTEVQTVEDQFAELIEVVRTVTEQEKEEWGEWKNKYEEYRS